MKPECHHPPYLISSTDLIPAAELQALAKQIAANPCAPFFSTDEVSIVPIECSWCRKPNDEAHKQWASVAMFIGYLVAVAVCVYLVGVYE